MPSHDSHPSGMPRRTPIPVAIAVVAACVSGCSRDEPPPTPTAGSVPAACVAFCEKANACATEQGRGLPDGARPCEEACDEGGVYRRAPAEVWACAPRPCGPAFGRCAQNGMLAAMRASKTPVFPPTCTGLCNRLGWCAEQLGGPSPIGQPCEVACGPGGELSTIPEAAVSCANSPCGGEMTGCLEAARRDGPKAPAPDLDREAPGS